MTSGTALATAQGNLKLLRSALAHLQAFESCAEPEKAERSRQEQGERVGHANEPRAAYDALALEVARALEEVGLKTTEELDTYGSPQAVSVIESACRSETWAWSARQRAMILIQLGIGEWELITRKPSRYPGPLPPSPSSQPPTSARAPSADSAASVTPAAAAAKAREPWLLQHKIVAGSLAVSLLAATAALIIWFIVFFVNDRIAARLTSPEHEKELARLIESALDAREKNARESKQEKRGGEEKGAGVP